MKILFIGGGNMSHAIISGLISNRHSIFVIDPVDLARKKILKLTKQKSCKSSIEVFNDLKDFKKKDVRPLWIILAIKPQQVGLLYREILKAKINWLSKSSFLSIVAGLSIKTLKKITQSKNIVRAMPNTPALIKMGVTGYYSTRNNSLEIQKQAIKILSQIGEVIKLPSEKMIDAVTAVSGSGPGYIFKFISAIEQAAVNSGLPKSFASKVVFFTVIGSIKLWEKSDNSSEELISTVASKGGTTQEALSYLESRDFTYIIDKAIAKAKTKSKTLSLEIDKQIQEHTKK